MKKTANIRAQILGAALSYAAKGWKVLPIYSIQNGQCSCSQGRTCPRPGKHPATRNGVHAATSDAATIRRWFGSKSQYNVAVATGRTSGLVVVDVDPRNGGTGSFDQLKARKGLPRTARSKTGGNGHHLFFKCPPSTSLFRKANLGAGIDLQVDGKYVVMPPSIHASGNHYRWIKDRGIAQKLASIPPEWLKPALVAPASVTSLPAPASGPVVPGERNNKLASFAGSLLNSGMNAEEILAALLALNAGFKPPLDDAEVRAVAASIGKREVHPPHRR